MLGIETGLLHDDDDSDLPGLLNFWDNEGDGDSTDDTEENFDNHWCCRTYYFVLATYSLVLLTCISEQMHTISILFWSELICLNAILMY